VKTLCFSGKIFSGKGEGAKFVTLAWVRKQIRKELGFEPYPGTLDLRITGEDTRRKKPLLEGGVTILPPKGFCRGRLFRACFKTELECGVVVPEVAGYPEDVIEIIAPENLREKFHLSDGDKVEIEVRV